MKNAKLRESVELRWREKHLTNWAFHEEDREPDDCQPEEPTAGKDTT